MAVPRRLNNRYEIREILGQGGMGIVYRAFDAVVKRDVALKTIRDTPTRAALQMFQRECEVLAAISHPNIIEIFDIGEFEEEGKSKPYFVMPLLPGATLDTLIRTSSQRLTVERTVEIILQTCRGLQAAHERGLVHRDIKPSNIWVMDDDSVKIIDFGVAHMVDTRASIGGKGTLLYMSPEQLQLKPPTAASDLFALGAVCYEALTRRRPFERATESEIIDAILHQSPPPASALNPAVSQTLSRVVHKAMAKQPWHRYSSAREFAETLQKAMRNEPIEFFDPARIQPRIERAQRAFEQSDYQFASEILSELEAEGHIDAAIGVLRRQIDQAIRQKTIAQLLDSARTRFDHEELPLALQKIEEVLQLDPGNAAALSLKADIENKLTAQKIDDWFRLASQHIDNHSYSHARQAIQNVLSVRPKEARALQMLAEVDRLEQEYMRIRAEKEQLFQAALDAWQSGEVSSALTKLERVLDLDQKSPDTSAPERAVAYRNLYNQVRSEHEYIKNSYAEARKHLSDKNFAQALAICNECLEKHPGHALFQALKFDIEEQQRQELSARIAEIDRRVEAEPDLDRRVAILEDAVKTFPGEPHFERALRLTRDKRDLVNSIVAKARYHEERNQFNEALGQLEILGTIYSQYPGLNFEVERVVKRRDQQVRSEAKARVIEQIDRCLQNGDHTGALKLLEQAEAEFPNDPELAGLREVTRQSMERTIEAQRLLAEGQELCAQQRREEGIQALRSAFALDERNPLIRAVLVDTLVEQARALLDADWRAAEGLILEALDLDPSHSQARSLRTLAQDRKRDEVIAQTLTRARELRAAGDLEAALAQAEQCLAIYPSEARLLQLRDVLARELREAREAKRRQVRRADLEELRALEREAAMTGDAAVAAANLERGRTIALRYPDDLEIQSVLADLDRRCAILSSFRRTPEIAEKPPQPPPAAPVVAEARSAPATATTPPQAKPVPSPPAVSAIQAPPAEKPRKASRLPVVLGVAAGIAAVAIVIGISLYLRSPGGVPAASVPLEIRTSPPGAAIRINDEARGSSNLTVELAPGAYQIEARLEGYHTARKTVTLAAGAGPVELTLEPLAPGVRVITDLEAGMVTLDERPAQELQEGLFTLEAVSPGKHTLKIAGRNNEEAIIAFEAAPAALPSLRDPVTKNLAALVFVNLGRRARLHSSFGPAKVELDGQPAGTLGPGGLELSNLSPGTHELVVGDEKSHRKLVVDAGPAPALTAYLQSDRDVGTLVVVAGEDGARVFLNGKEQRRTTSRGQLRIPNLPVQEYAVRVIKDGFMEEPELRATVRKGEETRLVFKLRPLPTVASLTIKGGPAGAQVALDQNPIGAIQPDGMFSYASVPPGEHTIELRLEKFKPKQIRRHFVAGETVLLSAGEVSLEKAPGRLVLSVQPRDAQVTIGRPGEPLRPVTGAALELPEGSYTVRARAPDYAETSMTVQVLSGVTQNVKLDLARMRTPPKPVVSIPAAWGPEWKQEGGWWVRRGGNFVFCQLPPAEGRFVFTAMLLRGRRLRWVANYVDERNHDLFEMDKRFFYHTVVRDGRRSEQPRVSHNLGDWEYVTIEVEVAGGSLSHRVQRGSEWVVLSSVAGAPGGNYAAGKFGFYIPGDDQVGISNFSFTPK